VAAAPKKKAKPEPAESDLPANARERQKQATQALILQAALEEFSERGFDGTSTRDIAARAGVHHALINYHFSSKDTLWREAVTFLFERQAMEVLIPRPNDKDFPDRRAYAKEVIRRVVVYFAHHPEHARLMVQESCSDSERFRWATDSFVTRTSRAAEQFIRFMQAEGFLPKAPVPQLVYIFVGAAQLFYVLAPEVQRIWNIDPFKEKAINDHVDALVAVLMR